MSRKLKKQERKYQAPVRGLVRITAKFYVHPRLKKEIRQTIASMGYVSMSKYVASLVINDLRLTPPTEKRR